MRTHALVVIVAFMLPRTCPAQFVSTATRNAPEIVTAGTGAVTLKPDRATLTVAVVSRAASAAAAGRLNTNTMLKVITALKRQSLADSAVVTSGYAVYLDPGDGMPRPAGAAPVYVARNALRVKVTDLEALGRLVDTALVAGATEITNISFASSQATSARERAIAAAVRAARSDAEAVAAASGGVLGDLIEVSLVPMFGGVEFQSGNVADGIAAYTPLMARDVIVQVNAKVRYAFVMR